MEENVSGEWFISDTKYAPLVHAKLGIAEENSGKLVTTVKKHAKQIAEEKKLDLIISDGPPGIGCAVIASMAGADMALLVTEPTLSGIHDLKRVNQVACHFGIKTAVCVNKYDINIDITKNIRDYCSRQNIEVIEEIPFDKAVVESLVQAVPVVEYKDSPASEKIKNLWDKVQKRL
jgi:MinD superfamily P-loop ATPase